MSKLAIAIAAAVGLLGFAGLLHAAAEPGADAQEHEEHTSRYLRGWRLALTQKPAEGESDAQADDDGEDDQHVPATTFAPEFYLDEEHIYIRSVTFGADRFFVLDAGRKRLPGWPCDAQCLSETRHLRPPSVRAYTPAGDPDANIGFDAYEFDGADSVVAIVHAGGKLYVMNDNPPKVYVYGVDGRRVPHEDFYLAGGERAREDGHDSDMVHLPRDFVHAAGRFYVLDQGTNQYSPKVTVYDTAGTRIPGADFRIDGLNYRVCGSGDRSCEWPETIIHANGTLHVRVWVNVPGWPSVDRPLWLYALDGSRTGTLHFDDSALFAQGMTLANDWFYLLSGISNIEPQRRVCAYTLQGQRVEPRDGGRYC